MTHLVLITHGCHQFRARGKVMTIPARTGHDRVCSGSEPWARVRPERRGGLARIAAFNIGFSHQETEYPQEPIQAWLDVKKIHDIPDFTLVSRNLHCLLAYHPIYFQPFRDGFPLALLKSASIRASLAGKARANDMQSCTTCRTRPVSSTSHKRTSSGRTREHDRRA